MNIYLLSLVLVLGCSRGSSSKFTNGVFLSDPSNQDATVALNFRINQSAVSAHHSFALLQSLELWREDRVPQYWDMPSLLEVREEFRFLHKKGGDEFTSVSASVDGNFQKLKFLSGPHESNLWTDKNVSHVKWTAPDGDPVVLEQQEKDTWIISKAESRFVWDITRGRLCDKIDCIDL